MSIQLGMTAPNFTADTTEGIIELHDYLGEDWGVLFSHPADFTPVCTTRARGIRPTSRGVRQSQRKADRGEYRLGGQPSRLVS